jgi:hypothetical protein
VNTWDTGLTISSATKTFFDRPGVLAAIGAARASILARYGYHVMTAARWQVRTRKRASKPGEGPTSWTGLLKRGILFGADVGQKSVVIGPVLLNSAKSTGVPRLLEFGGPRASFRNRWATVRKLGDTGEIRFFGKRSRTTKKVKVRVGENIGMGFTIPVTYGKLRTAAQVAHANRLNKELYGPPMIPAGTMEPRPYMKPAFEAGNAKLPEFLKQSVRPVRAAQAVPTAASAVGNTPPFRDYATAKTR